MNITEDYVSFEVAKLLKEKGFDEPCRAVYEEKVLRINTLWDYLNSELSSYICAPTHQMAIKWFREVHHIFIRIGFNRYYKEYKYDVFSMDIDVENEHSSYNFKSYEEAVEAALKYCLETLI